jgi:hypothetical protein
MKVMDGLYYWPRNPQTGIQNEMQERLAGAIFIVIPAQAGIQSQEMRKTLPLDPRLRGDDVV